MQMVSRGPDQGDFRPDQQIPQARFAHGAVRVPSTALDHGKVGNASSIPDRTVTATHAPFQQHGSYFWPSKFCQVISLMTCASHCLSHAHHVCRRHLGCVHSTKLHFTLVCHMKIISRKGCVRAVIAYNYAKCMFRQLHLHLLCVACT